MRAFAAVLLGMSLAAAPLLARNAGETGKEDTPPAPASTSAPDKPAPIKPEVSATETEIQDLRGLVEEQRAELEAQRAALKAQESKMEALEEKLGGTAAVARVSAPAPASTGAVTVPVVPAETTSTSTTASAPAGSPAAVPAGKAAAAQKEPESPLYFKIGGAEFYPLGFMDVTNFFRTTTTGTGIGTSFNSVPFSNTIPGKLTEDHFSAQNSRLGLRTHAKFGPADVTGYFEGDFLGFAPPNIYDTSNSDSFRLRLYWVDTKMGKFEFLGGQSWSLLTPNRNGLSALPGDLFYSQDMDTNYQLGLTWARQAGVRFLVHPTTNWVLGVSLENPEQTLPGGVVLGSVSSTSATALAANYGSQFDTNSGSLTGSGAGTNTSVPNLHPDIIVKTAFDFGPEGHHQHFDFAGLFRSFKAVNLVASTPNTNLTSANTVYDTVHGGGVAGTAYLELFKNFHFIGTAFWSSGGGRYIASTAGPDVVIRPDGNLAGVKAGSAIGGFEWQATPKTLFYGYASGAYFGKAVYTQVVTQAATGGTGICTITNFVGYGNPSGKSVNSGTGTCPAATGASGNANRFMYEPTFGIIQTFWRNPSYGDIKLITQYSYVSREPWVNTAPASGSILPSAHNSMVYVDLRYDLP
jgi:hypothetical protein